MKQNDFNHGYDNVKKMKQHQRNKLIRNRRRRITKLKLAESSRVELSQQKKKAKFFFIFVLFNVLLIQMIMINKKTTTTHFNK